MENLLKKQSAYGPDVYLSTRGEMDVVEKTFRNRTLPVRLLGVVSVFWEGFIYSRLEGLEGIPSLLESPDRYTLVTSYMGGENLRETEHVPGGEYFDAVFAIMKKMHERGVIHLDLRNRRNYGIDDEGKPYLVDFASALYMPFPGVVRKMLGSIDDMGFFKVKSKLNPGLVSSSEEHLVRAGRFLSSLWLPGKAFRALKSGLRRGG